MARALRRSRVGLAALVVASTLVYWLAGRRLDGLWIMPDEAIYGTRAIALWRDGSLSLLHGQGAGYSVLYPALAGAPLSIGRLTTGYALLKPVQAFVMSLATVPVYRFGVRLVSSRYALAAAALTLVSPLLLFSGFVMTEVLSYPLSAVALLAGARAVERATVRAQLFALLCIALAVLTRVQAVVFVPVLAVAILVNAALGGRLRLRAFWPVWAVLGAGIAAAVAAPGAAGAYSTVLDGGYPAGAAARLVYEHLAYVPVMTAVVPVAAFLALLRREPDPAARSLLAVTAAAIPLLCLQVGVFASRYSPHVLGRDLAPLPPLLYLCFALWLARGAPRPRLLASAAAVIVLAAIAFAPWNDLAGNALPDAMGLALLVRRPLGLDPATLAAIAAAVLLVCFRFLPARLTVALVPLAAVLLAATSVVASNLVAGAAATAQASLVGSPPDWIDRRVDGPVAFVFDGDTAGWPIVWQQRFWNPEIESAVSIAPNAVPGPIRDTVIGVPPRGRLPLDARYAVANDAVSLVGTPIAHQSRGPDAFGLTLWKLDGPPRLATLEGGFQPNGDIYGEASVTAFDCAGGRLELTLLPKASESLDVYLDGHPLVETHIGGLASWHTTIDVPTVHPAGPCNFLIRGDNLLGSTVVRFERR